MDRVLLPRRPLRAQDGRRRVRQLSRASRLPVTGLIAVGRSTTHPVSDFNFRICETLFEKQMASGPVGIPQKTVHPALCYSRDVVFLLYREAQRTDYFWIDDVHMAGTLAAPVILTHTPLGNLVLSCWKFKLVLDSRDKSSQIGVFLFGPPDLSRTEIHRLWQLVQDRRSDFGQAALQDQTPQVPSR